MPALRGVRAAVRADHQQAHRQRGDRRRLLHGRHPGPAGQRLLVARVQRRILRGRRGQDAQQGSLPALPRRAVRTAAPGGRRFLPGQRAADRDRPAGRRRGPVPDCINKGRYADMVQGLAAGDRHQLHPDGQDQRPGVRHHRNHETRRRWSPRSRRSSATCQAWHHGAARARHPIPARRRDRCRRRATPGRARDGGRTAGVSRCAPPARCGC